MAQSNNMAQSNKGAPWSMQKSGKSGKLRKTCCSSPSRPSAWPTVQLPPFGPVRNPCHPCQRTLQVCERWRRRLTRVPRATQDSKTDAYSKTHLRVQGSVLLDLAQGCCGVLSSGLLWRAA